MKVGDEVIFNNKPLDLGIVIVGSSKCHGTIKDFDGEYIIIKTAIGEAYVHEKEVKKK